MEYGPHDSRPLGAVLRNLGAADCEGRPTCLLIEDLPQVMELPANQGVGNVKVHFPVIATADFVVKRSASKFHSVVSMFALRDKDLKEILRVSLVPALHTPQALHPVLVAAARGDARQLCVQAQFAARMDPSVILRDAAFHPYEKVKQLLGGVPHWKMPKKVDPEVTRQESLLLYENFLRIPNIGLSAAADLAENYSTFDILDRTNSEMGESCAGKACRQCRGPHDLGNAKLEEFGGWKADKQRHAWQCSLQELRWQRARKCAVLWRFPAIAKWHFVAC